MQFFDKETSKGVIKYRMPNIIEAYEILETSGVGSGVSILSMKSKVIKQMEPLLDYSSIGVKDYAELLTMVDDMIIPLSEIADEIILKAFVAFKKKTT